MAVEPEAIFHQVFHDLVVVKLDSVEGENSDDGEECLELLLLGIRLDISDEIFDLVVFGDFTWFGNINHSWIDRFDAGSGVIFKDDGKYGLEDGRKVDGVVVSKR